jgi:hypothetical protein
MMRFTSRYLATTVAVAIAAFSAFASTASATVPPTTPPAAPLDASSTTSPDAPAPTDSGGVEVVQSWALTPASDNANSGTRPFLTYAVTPGDTVKDEVTVYNFGNVPLTLNIYGVDAFNNVDGKFDIRPAADEPADAGAWVQLDQNLVTVLPREQITIPVSITIPADATPGDHVGAVVAGVSVQSQNAEGQVINLERRTGTRLYIRVAGDVTRSVVVGTVTAEYRHRLLEPFVGGEAHVTYRLENRGNVRVGGKVTVEVSAPFGLAKRTVVFDKIDEILPGQKFELSTDVPDVRALMFGTARVTFEPAAEGTEAAGAPSTSSDSYFAPPIGLLLMVLLLIVVLLVLRRRRLGAQAMAAPQETVQG